MATVTVGEICTAIATEMATIASINSVQDYDELKEGQNTLPALQILAENWETDIASETDRTTFVDGSTGIPGVRQCDIEIVLALLVRQRSQLNEDWREAVDIASEVQSKLEEQGDCPIFGLSGIRSFHWRADRVVWDVATVLYTGYRFTLNLRIF